jgi:hypothetical protein
MTTPTDATSVDDGQGSLTDLALAVETADDVLTRLSLLTALAKLTGAIQRAAVDQAKADGRSWAAIGRQLGVSKQAAARRFGPPRDEPAPSEKTPAMSDRTPAPSEVVTQQFPRRAKAQWAVTTPGGRVLLRVVKGSRVNAKALHSERVMDVPPQDS